MEKAPTKFVDIVSVKFQDKNNPEEFSGKEYTYYAPINLKEGDIVLVETKNGNSVARVARTGIAEDEITFDIRLMKSVISLASEEIPFSELPEERSTSENTSAQVSEPTF